jgi:hypothetical protein
LLERVIVEGRPAFKTVRKLAVIAEDEICDLAAVERFWSAAMLKLGKLRRLDDRDRWHVESLIARKIPRPYAIPRAAAEMKTRLGPRRVLAGSRLRPGPRRRA